MNKYLEKIAREYIEQEHVETGVGNKIGAGILGAVSAGIVSKKISPMLTSPVLRLAENGTQSAEDSVMHAIEDEVLGATNTTRNIGAIGGTPDSRGIVGMLASNAGPSYMPIHSMEKMRNRAHFIMSTMDKTVGRAGRMFGMDVPKYGGELGDKTPFTKNYVHFDAGKYKNKDVLLHELGHAVDFAKGGSTLKAKISPFGRMAATPAAVVAGGMLASEKTRDYAWTVPLLASIPVMREEAAANINAMKMLKRHGANPAKFLRVGGANLLGYAAKPMLSAAVIAGINHLKRKGEEVNPEEWLSDRE